MITDREIKGLIGHQNRIHRLYHKSFTVKNVLFRCTLYRSGDRIYFTVNPTFNHIQIDRIYFNYELYCYQTHSHWKGLSKQYCEWSGNTMFIKDIKNENNLTYILLYVVDILRILYNKPKLSKKEDYYKTIKLKRNIRFNWNINEIKINEII